MRVRRSGAVRRCVIGRWHPAAARFTVRWWKGDRRAAEGRREDTARDVRPRRLLGHRPHARWLGGRALLQPPLSTLRAFEAFARAQSAMYRGGDREAVRERLAPDVVWHVPGESAIAGDHRGRDAVMAYFDRRRTLAGGAMTILPGARLVSGDVVVQLADGELERDGERLRWRTAGVYRFDGEQVAEAWLVPLELAAFDAHLDRAALAGGRLPGVGRPQQDQGHDRADGQHPRGGHPAEPTAAWRRSATRCPTGRRSSRRGRPTARRA